MSKEHQLGFLCGRFQPPHSGHKLLIEIAAKHCDTVLILIGSAQESGTLRNPFSLETRIKMLKAMCRGILDSNIIIEGIDDLKNEYNDSYSWGDYLIQKIKEITGRFPDCTIYGDDSAVGITKRTSWYRDEDSERMEHYIIPRDDSLPSATLTRGILFLGDRESWKDSVDVSIVEMFEELREILLSVPVYSEMYQRLKAEDNLSLMGFKMLYEEAEEKNRLEKLKKLAN